MKFNLNSLSQAKTNSRVRVGRGIGSGKGKTSGRGVKGQKARTGHHSVRGFEGGQTPVYMRLPKRGFYNRFSKHVETVTTKQLVSFLKSGAIILREGIVTKEAMKLAGLIRSQNSQVKLLKGYESEVLDFKVESDFASKSVKSLLA